MDRFKRYEIRDKCERIEMDPVSSNASVGLFRTIENLQSSTVTSLINGGVAAANQSKVDVASNKSAIATLRAGGKVYA